MKLRHEWKHEISPGDMLILRQRLRAVMEADPHSEGGKYFIRSLYFDTPSDTALREKLNGVPRREKFRIRYYNGDLSYMRLEKKIKRDALVRKESVPVSAEEARRILAGDVDWMPGRGEALLTEFYSKLRTRQLMPRTIVDYTREPFVYGPGNVRVTLDYDIRTGLGCTDFLDSDCLTIPAGDAAVVLEVKWDEFLPELVRDAVGLGNVRASAFSKYARCRIYG